MGEIVFNTAMGAYQDILTNPSYYGQIVNFTNPHLGNCGINQNQMVSHPVKLTALLAREYLENFSHPEGTCSLQDFLIQEQIPALFDLDTRKLARKIRNHKTLKGILSFNPSLSVEDLVHKIKNHSFTLQEADLKFVSTQEKKVFKAQNKQKFKVAVYDYGMKPSFIENLTLRECELTLFPYNTPSAELLNPEFHGIFLSNGPGNPENFTQSIKNIQNLIGKKPLFGVGLGHQLLNLALGAKTYLLSDGHRGANQPIKDLRFQKSFIATENHGYGVETKTLPSFITITHLNLNDNSIEGIEYQEKKCFSVQFYPENYLDLKENHPLNQFIKWMEH